MASILDPLVDKQGGVKKSANWYRTNVQSISDKFTARKLMNQGKLIGRPSVGRLNMFFYDPKFKKTLPYYDAFPLVLPLEPFKGGFMGMNFHYLPYLLRFRLLERMQKFSTGGFSAKTKIEASYDGIKNIAIAKPTIKKYLYSKVRSQFLRIDFDEAAMAVYLPVQQFKKAGVTRVWADSRSMI
tara:strand:- start:155 stop:706 length:552 start_codon:yes stop_codon:yes gene_type:complete